MDFSLEKYCLNKHSSIKEALQVIDKNVTGAAVVLNDNVEIYGIVTDGDIRRALLKGLNLNDEVQEICNTNYKFLESCVSKKKAKEFMLQHKIRQIPIINEEKKLIDIYILDDLLSYDKKDNYVFILAGGLGTRLRPLTENVPKPMLEIGGKPILERIINQFKDYGFFNFLISINYKGEVIEDYFKDGKNFDVNIKYIKETKKLGTAGSIKLAKNTINKPFIVINGDILTSIDFDYFLKYHMDNKFQITVGVRNYEIKVPYGVMVSDNLNIKEIKEKPVYSFNINSGVYAMDPSAIDYIPENEFYNMTDLINDILKHKKNAGIYNISEYWSDIGRMDDFNKANDEVDKIFD